MEIANAIIMVGVLISLLVMAIITGWVLYYIFIAIRWIVHKIIRIIAALNKEKWENSDDI